MNRIAPNRLTAVLLAMLFLLNGAGEAFGAHACPHHDPLASSADDHGTHAPATPGDDTGEPSTPDASHGVCTCQGVCPAGAVGALPVEATLGVVELVVPVRTVTIQTADLLLSRWTPFFLPYAQAPPLDC